MLAGFGLVAAAVGAKTGRPGLVEAARRVAFGLVAIVAAANVTMLVALLTNDFALRYVAENSARETPVFFKALSLWAADDGSLLLWNLILAGYLAAVAIRFRRDDRPPTFPYAMGVLFAVQVFYLVLVNGPARPFASLASPPADGRGPAPLLQNHPLMAVHPPFLYLGFIGFTVPFAFGIASLLAGQGSDQWVSLIRRWTLVVWCFLTVGLLLGALWSYSVLGWGGYWAWDPVENVALLPWLVSTAFLHSVMLQERRGMARLWNIALVIGAFALMTFGTFLTRGNVLSSVHAFAQTSVGPAYLAFLALVLLGGFGLVAWRLPTLRSPATAGLGGVAGRRVRRQQHAAAGGHRDHPAGHRVPADRRGGDRAAGDRRRPVLPQLDHAGLPADAAAGRDRAAAALAGHQPGAGAAPAADTGCRGRRRHDRHRGSGRDLGLRGRRVRPGRAGAGDQRPGDQHRPVCWAARRPRRGPRAAAVRRRHAGLVVHIGLALVAAGITASSTLGQQTQVTLTTGQAAVFGGQVLRYQGLRTDQQPQRIVLTATVSVTNPGGARRARWPRG